MDELDEQISPLEPLGHVGPAAGCRDPCQVETSQLVASGWQLMGDEPTVIGLGWLISIFFLVVVGEIIWYIHVYYYINSADKLNDHWGYPL